MRTSCGRFWRSLVVAVFGVACGSAGPLVPDAAAVGAEGQACYPNGTCDVGLVCLSDLCVEPGADAAVLQPDASSPSPSCGDGTCNGSETCTSCPGDCGACPAACGDGTCNGAETCTSCPGDCGACPPSITVGWEFPILVDDESGVDYFPSYVAHLLGTPEETHPWEFETACATIANDGATAIDVELLVSLVGYGTETTRSATVAGSSTTRICGNPIPDLTALYELHAPAPSAVEATVRKKGGGATLGSETRSVSVLPANDILWSHPDISRADMMDLSAVFVVPHDPSIEGLLTSVAERSVFAGFSSGYERSPYDRNVSISVGQKDYYELVFLEPGETLQWATTLVDGGSDDDIDVYLFTSTQYQAWAAGTGSTTTRTWPDQISGSGGAFTNGAEAGGYVLAFYNTPDNFASRTVKWSRSVSREDVVRDALAGIFNELYARGTTYTSVTSSYFGGAQHIKRADEVLETHSANCIDGSLVFASVLELTGMEPVLITKTGHAYMGVRSAPGSDYVWPIETTMVGGGDFWSAYLHAIGAVSDDVTDPLFHAVDVAAERANGILPMP